MKWRVVADPEITKTTKTTLAGLSAYGETAGHRGVPVWSWKSVQIASNAGLKRAARGFLKIQDAKNRQKIAIWAPSHNFVGLCLRN